MDNKSKCYLNGLSDEQIKKFFKEVNQNKERK